MDPVPLEELMAEHADELQAEQGAMELEGTANEEWDSEAEEEECKDDFVDEDGEAAEADVEFDNGDNDLLP
jgi:hypothetical protein